MANNNTGLSLALDFAGQGTLTRAGSITAPFDRIAFGAGANFGELPFVLTYGTGNGQANQWAHGELTILTGADSDLDLSGVLVSPLGETVLFTAIKMLLIAIVSPDGTKELRVGPQAVANAWQGPFGGVAAANYLRCRDWLPVVLDKYAGYPVTAGTVDILRLHNPTAGTVVARYFIAGLGS